MTEQIPAQDELEADHEEALAINDDAHWLKVGAQTVFGSVLTYQETVDHLVSKGSFGITAADTEAILRKREVPFLESLRAAEQPNRQET